MAWKSLDRAVPVPSSSAGRLKSSSKARGQLPPRRVTSSSAAHKFALKCHYSGTPEDGLSLFGLLLLACRRILSFWRWFVGSLVAKTSKTFLAVENFTLHPNFFLIWKKKSLLTWTLLKHHNIRSTVNLIFKWHQVLFDLFSNLTYL